MLKAAERYPEQFNGWAFPPRGAKAEFESILYQATNRVVALPPPNLEESIKRVAATYPRSTCPLWARGNEVDESELLSNVRFHMERNTVMDSTPGMPYKLLGPTNGKVLESFSVYIANLTVARIRKLASVSIDYLRTKTSMELATEGFCDPVRVFVKNEPHSLLKMSQGRYRIIASVSLVDSLLQRCVFQRQDELEIAKWTEHPSQPGIGFTDDMTKKFLSQIPSGLVTEADVTGWDWSVQSWEFQAEAIMRVMLVKNCSQLFARLTENLLFIQSFSVFSLSNGDLYCQDHPGIMKSGSKNTSSSNSRIRVLAHYVLNDVDPWIVAMGDDSLERWFPGAFEAYNALGHPIKSFEKSGNEFEFCGHVYDRSAEVCRPVNVVKMMVRFCAVTSPSPEQRCSLFMEIANALPSEKKWVWEVLRHLGEGVPNAAEEEE